MLDRRQVTVLSATFVSVYYHAPCTQYMPLVHQLFSSRGRSPLSSPKVGYIQGFNGAPHRYQSLAEDNKATGAYSRSQRWCALYVPETTKRSQRGDFSISTAANGSTEWRRQHQSPPLPLYELSCSQPLVSSTKTVNRSPTSLASSARGLFASASW